MDYIFINKLKIYANHGVLQFEKERGQYFYVDAKLYFDMHKAAKTDSLKETVNYALVCEEIEEVLIGQTYDLIESVAENTALAILKKFPIIRKVDITIYKPNAPVDKEFENISVNITREWHEVYLGIGSNMGDKQKYIDDALCQLETDEYIKDVRCSSLITTKPYGGVEQDDFLNGAVKVYTLYTPEELLECLHNIEANANRERKIHWGPRTLDLDILFYDDIIMSTEELLIPHIDMANRVFVLEPLMELSPYHMNYRENMTVKQMYEKITKN